MAPRISKALLIAFACLVLSCKGFTKGAWLTPYRSSVKSVSAAVAQLQKLKGLGVTRIYVDGFASGYMYAQSATWQSSIPGATNNDNVATICQAAQQVGGIEVVAWLEYGLRASSDYSLGLYGKFAQSKGWISGKSAGYYWISPDHADFRQWFTQVVADINNHYKSYGCFRGVQLDDNFHVPRGFSGVNGITTLVGQISAAVGSNWLSLAPAPMPFAQSDQNVNWPAWMNAGYAYEVIPQTYTASQSTFENEVATQLRYYGNKAKLGAGVRCQGSSAPKLTPVNVIRSELAYAQQVGLSSAVVWQQFCYGYYH